MDRCPVCDRFDRACPTLVDMGNMSLGTPEWNAARLAWRDCLAHAVDWRARAKAAEAELNKLRQRQENE